VNWTQRGKPARIVRVVAGLDQLLVDGERQVSVLGHIQSKLAESAQVASTIDSVENEETHENRSTVKRHAH
jgi:hypothetical protein